MNRTLRIIRIHFLLPLFAFVLLSCTSVRFLEDISAYDTKIKTLKARIATDTANVQALRDLGIIYFQTQHYPEAEKYLQKAYALNSQDPKTAFYFGMALEFQNDIRRALKIHERYGDFSRLSPYPRLMEGRYHRLRYDIVLQEITALLQQEREVSDGRISAKSVAVFPFTFEGVDEKFLHLGKGLSEMLIADLGQVRELQVLERFHLHILLQETALAQSDVMDPKTAPRIGKLLGAGKIVGGTYNVLGKEKLSVDALSWDTIKRHSPYSVRKSEALENLFKMEKDLVFNLIDEMGIELTPVEQEKIQFLPTKNMQAFIAYSNGLEREDAGDLESALKFYQLAIELDPSFELAKKKSAAAESLKEAGGSKEEAVAVAQTHDPPISPQIPTSNSDLLSNRLKNLSSSLVSNFVPGQDSRKPALEAEHAGSVFTLGELPEPPKPMKIR